MQASYEALFPHLEKILDIKPVTGNMIEIKDTLIIAFMGQHYSFSKTEY